MEELKPVDWSKFKLFCKKGTNEGIILDIENWTIEEVEESLNEEKGGVWEYKPEGGIEQL